MVERGGLLLLLLLLLLTRGRKAEVIPGAIWRLLLPR
jgi:hypothetical protein